MTFIKNNLKKVFNKNLIQKISIKLFGNINQSKFICIRNHSHMANIRNQRIFFINENNKRFNCTNYSSTRLNECEEGRYVIIQTFFTHGEEGFFVHKTKYL